MKLEIKHLSCYLPYGLKILFWSGDSQQYIIELNSLNLKLNSILGSEKHKPILSPISELDNLIKKEFEKYDRVKECDMEIINLFCYENTNTDDSLVDLDLNKLPYECVEYMFKNHYDFFGLIPAGLAIDKTTLK